MIKNISRLEHVINEKLYHFTCDMDSPIENVKDALFQFMKYVGQIEDNIKQQQAKQAADQAVAEPLPVSDAVQECESVKESESCPQHL
jgi:hypothetical protein